MGACQNPPQPIGQPPQLYVCCITPAPLKPTCGFCGGATPEPFADPNEIDLADRSIKRPIQYNNNMNYNC